MLKEDDQVKIMDFGLAKVRGGKHLTKVGTTVGTVAYMSPEQTSGEDVDHRSDIWSLGVLLYEMLTGQLPFKGDYDQAITYSILNEEQRSITGLRSGISLELERMVNKCLQKDPSDRYQHVDEFIVDLRQVKKESDTKELLSKTDLVTPLTQKKKRSFVIPGVMISVILLIIAGYFFFNGRNDTFPTDPEPIAVLPFENLTGNTQYDIFQKSIANLFISKLEQSKYMPANFKSYNYKINR